MFSNVHVLCGGGQSADDSKRMDFLPEPGSWFQPCDGGVYTIPAGSPKLKGNAPMKTRENIRALSVIDGRRLVDGVSRHGVAQVGVHVIAAQNENIFMGVAHSRGPAEVPNRSSGDVVMRAADAGDQGPDTVPVYRAKKS